MRKILFFSTILLMTISTHAANFKPAQDFFLSPQSLLHSGQAPRPLLEKGWQRDQFQLSYLVEKDRRQFWLNDQDILRDLHLSQFVTSKRTQKNYRVIRISQSSLLGEETKTKSQEWIGLGEAIPAVNDLGIAMNLVSTPLRKKGDWKSDISVQIPALTRLRIVDIHESWLQVEVASEPMLKGFVDLNNVVLKSDFAQFVTTRGPDGANLPWQQAKYRDGRELVLKDGKRILVQDITGLTTQPDLAISTITNDRHQLFLRQNLRVLKTEAQVWAESKIPGHGPVFWKKDQISSDLKPQENTLTNADILKMEISSVTFHPKAPHLGVVSATGIYITLDGQTWRKIPLFGNQSHPVLVNSAGVLFVGPYRSFDYGKTFQPVFRWEKLTAMLETQLQAAVQNMKLVSLSIPKDNQLHIEIQAAGKKIRLAGKLSGEPISHWDFISK